jgi:hypothetical protein
MQNRSLFLILVITLLPLNSLGKVVGIHVYQNRVFLEEVFPVRPGENRLVLAGNPSTEKIEISFRRPGFKILSLKATTVERTGPPFTTLKNLEDRQKALVFQKEALERKLSLLEAALNGKGQVPPPATYQKYMDLLDQLLKQKASLENKLRVVQQEISKLQSKITEKKTSALEVLVQGPEETSLIVKCPTGKILSWKEEVFSLALSHKTPRTMPTPAAKNP